MHFAIQLLYLVFKLSQILILSPQIHWRLHSVYTHPEDRPYGKKYGQLHNCFMTRKNWDEVDNMCNPRRDPDWHPAKTLLLPLLCKCSSQVTAILNHNSVSWKKRKEKEREASDREQASDLCCIFQFFLEERRKNIDLDRSVLFHFSSFFDVSVGSTIHLISHYFL